jgi:hypothetical protein
VCEAYYQGGLNAVAVLIGERYGRRMYGYIKKRTPYILNAQDREPLFDDALFGITDWIAAGLEKYPGKLMAKSLDALVMQTTRAVVIGHWRTESRYKRMFKVTDGLTDDKIVVVVEEATNTEFDDLWGEFKSDLTRIVDVLDFNEQERVVIRAYFDLYKEYEDQGEDCPKKGSLQLLADRVQALTGQPVTLAYVKERLKTAREKFRAYEERQRQRLFGDAGDAHEQDPAAQRRQAGGAPRPGHGRHPRGGGSS